jgi:dsDNA-specific endonuclease/ATPase MutS2
VLHDDTVVPHVGERVHVAGFGTGVVREVRNSGQCVVEIKGRAMIVRQEHLSAASSKARGGADRPTVSPARETGAVGACVRTLDLHGHTVEQALEALDAFLNDVLLEGSEQARVIHGRSGGRIRAAVHARLKEIPSVRSVRLDPRNDGVTVILF